MLCSSQRNKSLNGNKAGLLWVQIIVLPVALGFIGLGTIIDLTSFNFHFSPNNIHKVNCRLYTIVVRIKFSNREKKKFVLRILICNVLYYTGYNFLYHVSFVL